jgi:hypothetical protein
MSDGFDHRPPAYHTHAETSPSSDATIPSVYTPRHTSIDLTEAQPSPPEASKELPPSRSPQHDQPTIIDFGDSLKCDEEAANTYITPIPSRSWELINKIAVWLMIVLLLVWAGFIIHKLVRTADYTFPSKQGLRVSDGMSGSEGAITQTTTGWDSQSPSVVSIVDHRGQ